MPKGGAAVCLSLIHCGRLILDASGVGDPIYDDLKCVYGDIEAFKFTSVSKTALVQRLIVAVEQRRVSWPGTVREFEQKAAKGAKGGKNSHEKAQKAQEDMDGSNREIRQTREKGDRVLAEEQVAMLREAYDRVENLRDAVSFLFSGFFRGFAHLEKHYSASGLIERLEPVEQWFWVRDGMYGDWEYNQNAVSGRFRGIPIDPVNFVILDTIALNRLLSMLYLGRTLAMKDWDSFLEVYGIPSVFLIGPPNTPDSKAEEYQTIAEQLISDGRGYLPNGSDIKYVNGGGNRPPFQDRIEYIDRQITLVATGGLLTMLTEAGSGTLAGGAHTETFMQIARGDALTVSEVLQDHFDAPLLAEFFPGQPVVAYFEFVPPSSDEVSRVVNDAAVLAKAGLRVDADELRERTGYKVEAGV
jgi:phage gp29-like protein